MIITNLHVNKAFREQVDQCMNNKFGALTPPFFKNNKIVLALLVFYETRGLKP